MKNRPNAIPPGKDYLAAELEDPDRPFKTPDKRLAPPARRPDAPLAAPPVRRRDMTTRILSWEGSAAIHLAAVLIWLGAQRMAPMPEKQVEKPVEIIPVEVTFAPQAVVPAPKAAPVAPMREPDPVPAPKAPEVPQRPVQRQQAAAPKPLPPKPAARQAAPAPKPAQKAFEQPKKPDLNAALQARLNQGRAQEEQRLSQLRDQARTGSEDAPKAPGAGTPAANPHTSTSGLSGSVASRGILSQVRPVYPESAQRRLAEGTVVVKLWVNAGGTVTSVELVRSSGHLSLDRAAMSAARQWVFSPADGEALQWGVVPFNFTI